MSLVLDASITVGWLSKDEWTPSIEQAIQLVTRDGAVVPTIWALEVANVLLIKFRKKQITLSERDQMLDDLRDFAIEFDQHTTENAWLHTLRLAERHGLTTYDACYLELALRRHLPLATLDVELRSAADMEGVALFGL